MDEPRESSHGVLASLRRIVDNVLGLAQSRLELLSVELHEEKYRLIELLGWTLVAVVFGLMALIAVSFAIVVVFWDHAVPVLIVMSVLYITGTILAVRTLRAHMTHGQRPLADSLNELEKDRACLQTENWNRSPSKNAP